MAKKKNTGDNHTLATVGAPNAVSYTFTDGDGKPMPVRVMTDGDGEPWFVGKDVAVILGYSNPRKAIIDHVDDEDKGVTKRDTLGGTQNMTVINESGLYSLVLSSKLPKAKDFKRWVTHEVLPSIRKHGGYMAGQERMTPEQMLAASMRWLESRIREQEETIASQSAKLEEQKPKVLFADAVSASDGTCLVGELAKMLGVRPGTVSSHYKRGDMPVTQFLAIADMAGADASRLIAKATEETKDPQDPAAGEETRKDKENGFQHQ